ncbi:MAG: Maf family protein [Firmicutes bacterium]|nr:Maf family protein [Bacillota bacterium]
MQIVLASASPRRTALLAQAGIAHRVMAGNVDESISDWTDVGAAVTKLALRKAHAVAAKLAPGEQVHDLGRGAGAVSEAALPEAVVIGADTVVAVDDRVLGKPGDVSEARAMLGRLAGRSHDVFTGVALVVAGNAKVRSGYERTRVVMRPLSAAVIAAYAATGEGLDKAGAYAIQGMAGGFVTRIDGDPHNVIGLPLGLVVTWLEELGYPWLCGDSRQAREH